METVQKYIENNDKFIDTKKKFSNKKKEQKSLVPKGFSGLALPSLQLLRATVYREAESG